MKQRPRIYYTESQKALMSLYSEMLAVLTCHGLMALKRIPSFFQRAAVRMSVVLDIDLDNLRHSQQATLNPECSFR